jgi:hypothetical protein
LLGLLWPALLVATLATLIKATIAAGTPVPKSLTLVQA